MSHIRPHLFSLFFAAGLAAASARGGHKYEKDDYTVTVSVNGEGIDTKEVIYGDTVTLSASASCRHEGVTTALETVAELKRDGKIVTSITLPGQYTYVAKIKDQPDRYADATIIVHPKFVGFSTKVNYKEVPIGFNFTRDCIAIHTDPSEYASQVSVGPMPTGMAATVTVTGTLAGNASKTTSYKVVDGWILDGFAGECTTAIPTGPTKDFGWDIFGNYYLEIYTFQTTNDYSKKIGPVITMDSGSISLQQSSSSSHTGKVEFTLPYTKTAKAGYTYTTASGNSVTITVNLPNRKDMKFSTTAFQNKPKMLLFGMRYRYIGNGSPFEDQFLAPGAAGFSDRWKFAKKLDIIDTSDYTFGLAITNHYANKLCTMPAPTVTPPGA